jgi:hypothetical protein
MPPTNGPYPPRSVEEIMAFRRRLQRRAQTGRLMVVFNLTVANRLTPGLQRIGREAQRVSDHLQRLGGRL